MMLDMTTAAEAQSAALSPGSGAGTHQSWLLCRAASTLCALPVEQVLEVMRVLPLEPFAAAPRYVLGLSIIRGVPVPVVDFGLIVGNVATKAARLVTIKTAGRIVALAMKGVIGITEIGTAAFDQLPPLLQDAAADTIAGIGARDSGLLIFLRAGRIVPEQMFDALAETSP
jgi:purine-binding chemotaxis protein CheW